MKKSIPCNPDAPVVFSRKRTMRDAMNDAFRLIAQAPKAYFFFLSLPVISLSLTTAAAVWMFLREWLTHRLIPSAAAHNNSPEGVVMTMQHTSPAEIACITGTIIISIFLLGILLSAIILQIQMFRNNGDLPQNIIKARKEQNVKILMALWILLKAIPKNFTLIVLSSILLFVPITIVWMPTFLLGLVWEADMENILFGEPSTLTDTFNISFILCTAFGTALSSLFAAWQIWAIALYGKLLPPENR